MPKRKHEETDDSRSDAKESLNGAISDCSSDEPERKRSRKSVNFEDVQVFYFNRTQGFVCVPSQGGTTLGMSDKHQSKEVYKLSEYLRRRKVLQQRRQSAEASSSCSLASEHADDDGGGAAAAAEDGDDDTASDENSRSTDRADTKAIDEEEEEGGNNDDDDEDEEGTSSNVSILPVPVRRRRMMLRLSGVRKIDAGERAECQEIRQSREFCGCTCQTFCDPDTCECSQDGIQCQVDRMRFPCGCTREGCGNKAGRIEFNPARVRTHFVHTIMRLELEKQLADAKSAPAATPPAKRRHIRFDDDGEPAQQLSAA